MSSANKHRISSVTNFLKGLVNINVNTAKIAEQLSILKITA